MNIIHLFREYIKKQGVVTTEQGEAIGFSMNDIFYLFLYDADDPTYFRLAVPRIEDAQGNEKGLIKSTNDLNYKYKVAKGAVIQDGEGKSVWVFVEQFVYSPIGIENLFGRSIGLLAAYVAELKENKN